MVGFREAAACGTYAGANVRSTQDLDRNGGQSGDLCEFATGLSTCEVLHLAYVINVFRDRRVVTAYMHCCDVDL